jgi:hypothetical protein
MDNVAKFVELIMDLGQLVSLVKNFLEDLHHHQVILSLYYLLYKPLFRTFRTILRDHMLTVLKESDNAEAINMPIREQAWLFMHEIKMPDEFLNLKSLHSMMLLLFARVSHE